jgi:hypothetical protein
VHSRADENEPLYLDHPQFEGFEAGRRDAAGQRWREARLLNGIRELRQCLSSGVTRDTFAQGEYFAIQKRHAAKGCSISVGGQYEERGRATREAQIGTDAKDHTMIYSSCRQLSPALNTVPGTLTRSSR